ncbi:hypothetical protein [Haloglomus halophilum]|uniref:hypothetical protein n=1 Tax=Haloglomus halophilum TaxID=2962672 RepID=UPI0020C9CEEC|nr:hypothetical protein [Haloglomus halophilum]
MSHDEPLLEQLPPEKLLDTANFRVITPAIPMMEAIETVEQYLEHERANRNRAGIIRRLTDRIDAIYEETGERPSETGSKPESTPELGQTPPVEPMTSTTTMTDTLSVWTPSRGLLDLVHDHEPGGLAGPSMPLAWEEL